MNMTNEEIVRSYKQAAKPAEQLHILAELNDCPVSEIRRVLRDGGIDGRALPKEKANPCKRKPEPAGGGAKSIRATLQREKEHLERRAAEIPQLLAALQAEQTSLKKKHIAVSEMLQLLSDAYDDK